MNIADRYFRVAIDQRYPKRRISELTHAQIDHDIAAYLERGGRIHQIEAGATGEFELFQKKALAHQPHWKRRTKRGPKPESY